MHDTRKHDPSAASAAKSADKSRAEPALPLAGSAFASPLAFPPVAESSAKKNYKLTAVVLLGGALVSAGVVGMALLVRTQTVAVTGRARTEPAVLRAETPSEASIRLAPPRANNPPSAALATTRGAGGPSAAATKMGFAAATGALPSQPAAGSAVVQPTVQAIPVASAKPDSGNRAREDRKRRASPPQPALPEELTRDQVIAGMRKITPAVNACFGDARGKVTASFSVIGKTGRIVGARVTGGKAKKINSCIARNLYRARFPKFAKARIKISYPFAR